MNTTTILAHWDADSRQYITEESSGWDWRSEDGSVWETGDGVLVESDEFRAATIRLIGGPYDGEEVL